MQPAISWTSQDGQGVTAGYRPTRTRLILPWAGCHWHGDSEQGQAVAEEQVH